MNTVEGLYINGVLVPVVNGILDRSETSILSKDIVTGYETLETVHELRLKGFGIVKIPPIVRCTGLKVLQLGTTSIA